MIQPVICFGQQPCGIFPKRFLYSKIQSAKKLQSSIGGKIIFFYHDSDADSRETITLMSDRRTGADARLNFLQPNKIQKKFSPLYAKHIASGWKEQIQKQLPRFVDAELIEMVMSVRQDTVADFCLQMYKKMGLLEGVTVMRSGNRAFREKASDLEEFYADITYQGEIVRALRQGDGFTPLEKTTRQAAWSDPAIRTRLIPHASSLTGFTLHEGGGRFIALPPKQVEKWQKSPGRDIRFFWMQSVIHCTHYVMGASEKKYLDRSAFPEVTFIERDPIYKPNYAWLGA